MAGLAARPDSGTVCWRNERRGRKCRPQGAASCIRCLSGVQEPVPKLRRSEGPGAGTSLCWSSAVRCSMGTSARLPQVRSGWTVDELLERLVELIVSRNDAYTRRVPTERELADTLGVNRATVREGLAVLQAFGLIRRAHGSGTYIDMPHSSFVQLYFDMAVKLNHVKMQELEEAREMLEREATRQAAIYASDAEIAALRRCVERMIAADSLNAAAEANYEFHLELVCATHNSVMRLIFEGLSSALRPLMRERRSHVDDVPGARKRITDDHLPILDALAAHDPDRAADAMDEHFRVWDTENTRRMTVQEPGKSTSATETTDPKRRPSIGPEEEGLFSA